MIIKTGIGQDSHAFDLINKNKKLVLGGVVFDGYPPLKARSDGDVIFHALANAISGITGVNILGARADKMCLDEGIKDSSKYVLEALKYMKNFSSTKLWLSLIHI